MSEYTHHYKEYTHHYKAGCGLKLIIIDSKEGLFIKVGKSGECNSIMWEVISKLLNEIDREKAIKIMEHYICEKAIPGNRSCFDSIAKFLKKRGEK